MGLLDLFKPLPIVQPRVGLLNTGELVLVGAQGITQVIDPVTTDLIRDTLMEDVRVFNAVPLKPD